MSHTLFYALTAGALLLAGILLVRTARQAGNAARLAADNEARAEAAEYAAHVAETEAAISYTKGYRDATDEINARRDREAKASYDRGFENGFNACVDQCEARAQYEKIAAA